MLDQALQGIVFRRFDRFDTGALSVTLPDGSTRSFGPGGAPSATLRVLDNRFFRRLVRSADIGFGEAWQKGEIDSPDLTGLLTFFIANRPAAVDAPTRLSLVGRAFNRLRHLARRNTIGNSRRNIQAHYDLGNEFYRRFLDPTMMYSGAVFEHPEQSLHDAQLHKIGGLIDMATPQPGDRLLEVGCGWGGFALEAAGRTGCLVHGLTLSDAQLSLARERMAAAGLSDRVNLEIRDYRRIEGVYDRLVSIEMIEAVGHEYLDTFFHTCGRALKTGGRFALQVITIPDARYDAYRRGADWIQKHVFPGGNLPSVGALTDSLHRTSRLVVERVEEHGRHYVPTIRHWREKFHRNWDEIRPFGFDDHFRRTWDYYLAYCEAAFATGQIHLHQFQMVRKG
ncbi:MAG: cyclopropane-fatty-acyl-phospholipid synthase family protein [Kiritimatiellia bacterium]